jgi:Uma2 family endonuclease
MTRAGVFDEDDRLELLDGEIIQMNPVGRRHVATVNRLTRVFARLFGERALISVQNPLVLDSGTEPRPDLVLLRPLSLPTGQDAYLVVEVADTTVVYDTTRKARAYAPAGVPSLWVVALGRTAPRDRVLLFSDPIDGSYSVRQHAYRGEVLTVPAAAHVPIAISDFL